MIKTKGIQRQRHNCTKEATKVMRALPICTLNWSHGARSGRPKYARVGPHGPWPALLVAPGPERDSKKNTAVRQ